MATGEVQYETPDGMVHSDLNPQDRENLHAQLDEWLDCSNDTGFFYVGNIRRDVSVLRVAAKIAVRDARDAENLSCYYDGSLNTRKEAEEAYNAALKAIDALAEAIELKAE